MGYIKKQQEDAGGESRSVSLLSEEPIRPTPFDSDWTLHMTHSHLGGAARRFRLIGTLALAAALTATTASCGSVSGADDGAVTSAEAAAGDLFSQDLHDQLPERIRSAGQIAIGGAFDNPPVLFASASDATKPAGVAYDLSQAIGKVLGVEATWANTQWAGQLPGLDGGKLDIVWGQATVTKEREESLYDMIPFYRAPLAVLVKEGNPKDMTSFESMCGQTIGGSVGAVQERYVGLANEKYCAPQGKKAIAYSSYAQGEETALNSGAIDGVIDTYPVLVGATKKLEGMEAVLLSDAAEFDSGFAGIVFSKKNPELSETVAAALQKLHEAGIYQDILAAHDVPDAELDAKELTVNLLTGTPAGEVK